MTEVKALLDANHIWFTVPYFDYPMSYLEFFGTVLNLLCVYLLLSRNILTWPVGIIGTILFGILFYQIRLYADFFEQVYYFWTGILGWFAWQQVTSKTQAQVKVGFLSFRELLEVVIVLVTGSIIASVLLMNIHRILPSLFPDPASYAIVDATTTVMSFVAQYLLIRRKVENWFLWIAVDVAAVWLYWVKDVKFIWCLYLVFLVLAIKGLIEWLRAEKEIIA